MNQEKMELVSVLNRSLSAEYGALFLLPQHLASIKNTDLQGKLREIMEMELEHAEKTARIILSLGAKPVADFPQLRPRTGVREILEVHLEGERHAIELYTLAASKCQDPKLKEMLLQLKAEEESHQKTIELELARVKER